MDLRPNPIDGDQTEVNNWLRELYNYLQVVGKFECEFIEMKELSADPDAPGLDRVRVYAKVNGGKTTLYARFNTGAVQAIAAEP